MPKDLTRIEAFVRVGEVLDHASHLVLRGWPLTVEGLLHNADATRRRYSAGGHPFVAVSAEATVDGWDVDSILAGPRLRTRRTYAAAPVGSLLDAGFELLATFAAPHYSVILPSYTRDSAQRLIKALGEVRPNPHHVRREQ
ncbi:MAG: hypothetical protein M3527_09590 [Actinomycetota bacterium]|nr:hypothetical protein [Acidimicrobiia bacterium]MDQ3294683.1 hypothetical protein [Actinomycetota bacterium]